ncbi:MAG: GntR family transcriptional regulator [Betaproteobacteria bacterium]
MPPHAVGAPPRQPPAAPSALPARSLTSLPLSAEILATLSREVLAGDIPPGTKLDEEALCKRFSASRTPVREAVRQLAAQGVVEIRPRQGAFVVQPTVESLAEMFEYMGFLEAACAELAARRHSAQDRVALAESHDACVRAAEGADPGAFYAANNRFHECVYQASHNHYLAAQTIELRNRLEAYRREVTFHDGLMRVSIAEHQAALDAIFAMNGNAAAQCMRQHLDTLGNDAVSIVAMLSKRPRIT